MQQLLEFTTANPWLMSGLIASGLAVLFNELRLKSRDLGSLSTAMAVRTINDGSDVVDLRTADKFAEGHILDATNIPATEFTADAGPVRESKTNVLLVCDTGSRSSELTARLRKEGLENVFSLKGGMAAWQQDNLPVIR